MEGTDEYTIQHDYIIYSIGAKTGGKRVQAVANAVTANWQYLSRATAQ